MAEQPLARRAKSFTTLNSRVRNPRAYRAIRYRIDINNLLADVESLPLNGIGLVEMTFDEPLALDIYQQKSVTGGLILSTGFLTLPWALAWCGNWTANAERRRPWNTVRLSWRLNALVRRHFSHWDARDLLGDKRMALHDET